MFFVNGSLVMRQFFLYLDSHLVLRNFAVDVSKMVTGIFGEFLNSLEQRNSFINLSKKSSSGSGYRDCINSSLVGRFALVLYPGTHPKTGELIFDDNLDRFLYAKCSGFEDNHKGFYFKWLQYEGDDQNDTDFYFGKDWKVIWLPQPLSDNRLMF